ncbi:TPA: hypothetical protein DDW35_08795 [Candidatus Sumerlaeota bacterium]|nr:hypothetical protein [Candidatus Sumerlaeota bacterium]
MTTETPSPNEDIHKELDLLLRKAEELYAEKKYDEAVGHLQQMIERFPDSPLPHHDLAVVYLSQLYDKYQHMEVWEDLADDEAIFEAAVAAEEAALDVDGEFVPALNNLGTLFALRGWWEDAVEEWDYSLSIDPEQPELREDLAEVRERVGE